MPKAFLYWTLIYIIDVDIITHCNSHSSRWILHSAWSRIKTGKWKPWKLLRMLLIISRSRQLRSLTSSTYTYLRRNTYVENSKPCVQSTTWILFIHVVVELIFLYKKMQREGEGGGKQLKIFHFICTNFMVPLYFLSIRRYAAEKSDMQCSRIKLNVHSRAKK